MVSTKFQVSSPLLEEGVIVGTNKDQEWLLPWWWMHFRMHSIYPVTFIDFGDMSPAALAWCHEKGQVLKLEVSDSFMAFKESIDPIKAKDWESMHPEVWHTRFTWYKKPFAFLLSPYKKTLWLDVDCQIRDSLHPFFELDLKKGGMGVVPENEIYQKLNLAKGRMLPGQITYNSGVIIYDHDSPIMHDWAEKSLTLNHLYCSEQQLLVHILFSQTLPYVSLPYEYNWTVDQKENPHALILHWWGGEGKKILRQQIEFLTSKMSFNFSFNNKIS